MYPLILSQDELQKIVLTACLTITGGVLVFALTKIIEAFFISPLIENGKALGEVAGALYGLGEIYANPLRSDEAKAFPATRTRYRDAKSAIRKVAGDLVRANGSVRWYWLARALCLVPRREDVKEVVGLLTGISNNLDEYGGRGGVENSEAADRILALIKWPKISK